MNIAVIFAGGTGSRMYSKDRPKQFLEIQGKPIIVHTLSHFEENGEVHAIVIACIAEWMDYLNDLIYKYRLTKVKKVVPGGATGQLSIYNGLVAAKEIVGDEPSVVLIHDGVRPLITSQLITDNITCVHTYGNCITGAVIKETVTEIQEDRTIVNVTDRTYSRVARAPQSFWLTDILQAHEKAMKDGKVDYIDSCSLMRHYGMKLHLLDGPYENIKITTPDDFYMMRSILQLREDKQLYGL